MISYRIELADLHAHLFRVTLTVPKPAAAQELSLPVWIPGSYLVREFARHLSGLKVRQGTREPALSQLDKATWQVDCAGATSLTVSYLVYAFDTSVRAAFLDAGRGFFNGTGVCLRVHGREHEAHAIELRSVPRGWQVATAMRAAGVDAAGRGRYVAADYDELVDHPFELGPFWRGSFKAAGVAHTFAVAGALPDFDGERLLADTRRICEAQIAFWHGPRGRAPFDHYAFLLNTAEDGHGGLEHRASTALLAARRDLPRLTLAGSAAAERSDGEVGLLGLISHEYFHTWNVKRMRPAEFARCDYTRENYTELLWFFEGFTSYYDDLLLLRSGLIDEARYLRLLARTASGVWATPGAQVQSVAQSSFDAWVKYYRQDENTPNATVSYYTKGALVALALDLTLRSESSGSLDDVMRQLWRTSAGGPISEADIAAALQAIGGRSYAFELAQWVHGTEALPLQDRLAHFAVDWQHTPATLVQRLGLRASESALTGVRITQVLRGGAAEQAGLSAGDDLLAVDGWRVRRLDDALRLLKSGMPAALLVARDQRVLTLNLTVPDLALSAAAGTVTLIAAPKPAKASLALRQAWLNGR